MTHFVYEHLPAQGIGVSDPYRPKATGGIGHAVFIVLITDYITGELTLKWFYGDPSDSWRASLSPLAVITILEDAGWDFTRFDSSTLMGSPDLSWSTIVDGTLWSVHVLQTPFVVGELDQSWLVSPLKPKWETGVVSTAWTIGAIS